MTRSPFGQAFVLGVLVLLSPASPAQTYNLRTDWSNAANPNGVWSIREGTSILPSGTWSSDFTPQPAWLGTSPCMWLKAQSTAGYDVQVGDVGTHSSNSQASLGNVAWTSPGAGTINLSGGVWMIRDIGRANDWFLRKNGGQLSTGSLFSGDAFNSANPFNLNAGSG